MVFTVLLNVEILPKNNPHSLIPRCVLKDMDSTTTDHQTPNKVCHYMLSYRFLFNIIRILVRSLILSLPTPFIYNLIYMVLKVNLPTKEPHMEPKWS